MPSRRQFIQDTAFLVGAAGLNPLALVRATAAQQLTALQAAVLCAEWIDRSSIRSSPQADTHEAPRWPADPLKPERIGLDLYNGMPGVVYFFANLAHATDELKWKIRAGGGGDYLVGAMDRTPSLGAGLYTGLAGLAATFMTLHATGLGDK